tara:strand:- start:329 stop:946 length:618 start_codon:yes stop_codon:yes gene_type:complete
MKSNKILIVGAGGHARSCIDVIEQNKKFKIVGLIDKKKQYKFKIFNYPIIGTNKDLKRLSNKIPYVLIGVGQIKKSEIRKNLFKEVIAAGFKLPTIISPQAYVSPHAKIAEGTIIMHGAIVNANAKIGKNCIINSRSLVEHDVVIGDHCHLATSSVLNGGVNLGSGSFVGSGAIIKEGLKVGQNCIISANKFLFKNLKSNKIYKY